MDTQSVDSLAEEAAAATLSLAAALEGLEDYQRLNLGADTQIDVAALLTDYQRRRSLLATLSKHLVAARAAIEAVLADGHPAAPTREVAAEVFADLEENLVTLTDAHGRFSARPLTTGGTLDVGPETPVPG